MATWNTGNKAGSWQMHIKRDLQLMGEAMHNHQYVTLMQKCVTV